MQFKEKCGLGISAPSGLDSFVFEELSEKNVSSHLLAVQANNSWLFKKWKLLVTTGI